MEAYEAVVTTILYVCAAF